MALALLWFGMPGATQEIPPGLRAEMPDAPTGRLEHILRRGTLIVGVKDDYPPWGMLDQDGRSIGLEPDLAADLAARMGVELELRAVTSANRMSWVNQGLVDVVIATTGDTAERRLQADLLQPSYYSSGVVLYARADLDLTGWEDVRGQPVCLSRGSYYNRTLEETYGVEGQYFSNPRESRLALRHGRCIGWAFDDTALAQLVRRAPSPVFAIMNETIEVTPWVVIVQQGEGDGDLGRFVSDVIAEWHGSGQLLALQAKWGLPETEFLVEKQALWGLTRAGRAVCARDPVTGQRPAGCLDPPPLHSAPETAPLPWMLALRDQTGIDLTPFANAYNRDRLLRGLGLTLGLSAVAILGAWVVGLGFAALHLMLSGWGRIGQILLLPQRALIMVARMTPPILQLYIFFFGLGSTVLAFDGASLSAFGVAALILSLYAGATNAVILIHASQQVRAADPSLRLLRVLPLAAARGFDGLVAASVNIVKAAGMASAIAVAELISTINLIVSEGADPATLMNGLLVFYFLLVLLIVTLFKRLQRVVVGR